MRLPVAIVASIQYVALVLLLTVRIGNTQDLSVYGLFDAYVNPIESRKINRIYSSCFQGLGLVTCSPSLPDDDIEIQYVRPYLRNLDDIQGANYCVECCGDPPNRRDVWDLTCELDEDTALAVNVYGFELRMARNRNPQDDGVITCPLRRQECSYSSVGETLGCNRTASDKAMFLTGYTVKLTVEQYDKNFEYWRGVSKCEIETEERNTSLKSGDYFHEKIVLIHQPKNTLSVDDGEKLAVLGVLGVLLIYVALYFCRKKHCEYCQQKLVFSPRICYKCRLVGAQPPDPELLKALELKGEQLQGTPPAAFPGAATITALCGHICSCLLHCCCYCCCCFNHCCYSCYDPRKVLPDFEEEDAELAKREQEAYSRITTAATDSVEPFADEEPHYDSDEERIMTPLAATNATADAGVPSTAGTALENGSLTGSSVTGRSVKTVRIDETANSHKYINESAPVGSVKLPTTAAAATAVLVPPTSPSASSRASRGTTTATTTAAAAAVESAPLATAMKKKKKPRKIKNPNLLLYSAGTIRESVAFTPTKPMNRPKPMKESLFS